MVKFKKDPRKYQGYIWFLLIFLFTLLVFLVVTRWVVEGEFQFIVRPREGSDAYFVSVPLNKIAQIVFLGPVFGIVYLILMKLIINKIEKNNRKIVISVWIMEISVLVLVCINSMGHALHLLVEEVNMIDASKGYVIGETYNGVSLDMMALLAWYLDEWFGHMSIHVTYFGYLVVAVVAEYIASKHEKIMGDEAFLVIFGAIGIAVINGYAAIEGESGFLLLVLSATFSLISIIVIGIKKIKILNYPIFLALILSVIPVLLFNIVFIMENGVSPWFPYWGANL